VLYYIEQSGPTFLQATAFLLWIAGILMWMFRHEKKCIQNYIFISFCTLALFSIISFHCMYASGESYIFSAHAWPYLVLPGVIAFRNSWLKNDYWPITILIAAVALSILQMILGLNILLNLKPPPDIF
jgi:hypothetical protein